jgi:hypothetical protein
VGHVARYRGMSAVLVIKGRAEPSSTAFDDGHMKQAAQPRELPPVPVIMRNQRDPTDVEIDS